MKKLFWVITIFVALNLSGLYFVLFTTSGNGFLSGVVESRLSEQGLDQARITEFKLTPNNIVFTLQLDSTSHVMVYGDIDLFSQRFDMVYDVVIGDLSLLHSMIKTKLNGPFQTKGTIKGDRKLSLIDGNSTLFSSELTYNVQLKSFELDRISYNMKQGKIDQILSLLNQPRYVKGILNSVGDIQIVDNQQFTGSIKTQFYDGQLISSVLNERFSLGLKRLVKFKGETISQLKGQEVISQIDVMSSLINVSSEKFLFRFPQGTINADYRLYIDDLADWYDIIQRPLNGSFGMNGTIAKNDHLVVTGVSNLWGGKMDVKLDNTRLTSSLEHVDLKSLMTMLTYPQIFDSRVNATLDYDLISRKGQLDATLLKGHFLPNQFSSILKKWAKFDLQKEVYDLVQIQSRLESERVYSSLEMKSKNTSIVVPNSVINTKEKHIDAKIESIIKNIPVKAKITGSLDKPTVNVDTKELIKSSATKQIEHRLKDKLKDIPVKDIVDGLKGFFN